MQKSTVIALALLAAEGHAEPARPLLHRASEEATYQMFKDDPTLLGKAVRQRHRDNENRTLRAAPQLKSARECAKPGNVIDEDVRRCMKGM